jgi:hypothetical protein
MAAGDLTTLQNVKLWMGTTGVTDDQTISRAITAISTFIQSWLNRQLLSASYTENRDGTDGYRLSFQNYPVTAVASLFINGVSIPASPPPSSSAQQLGFVFTTTLLSLIGYRFSRGFNNVQIAYTAGFAAVPADIEQACIETIALRLSDRTRIGYSSKSIAGETVSFIITDFSKSSQSILNNYKKVVPV